MAIQHIRAEFGNDIYMDIGSESQLKKKGFPPMAFGYDLIRGKRQNDKDLNLCIFRLEYI